MNGKEVALATVLLALSAAYTPVAGSSMRGDAPRGAVARERGFHYHNPETGRPGYMNYTLVPGQGWMYVDHANRAWAVPQVVGEQGYNVVLRSGRRMILRSSDIRRGSGGWNCRWVLGQIPSIDREGRIRYEVGTRYRCH